MYRKLVSLLVAFAILWLGYTAPVYASPIDLNSPDSVSVYINGDNNNVFINPNEGKSSFKEDSFQLDAGSILKSFIQEAAGAAGAVVGITVLCYAADAAATELFPPAALLASYCPQMGGIVGGGTLSVKAFGSAAKAL